MTSTPDYAELVRRLRTSAHKGCLEAADAIESLAARVAELERERDVEKATRVSLWNVCIETLNELPRLVDTTDLAQRARAVVARIAALERERDELRADFERYAQHTEACDWAWAGTQEFKCNCGLDAARARRAKERT